MAQRVQVVLTDDLDQSPANQTVSFGLDGVEYEIDLSDANAAALRNALARYVASARKIGGRRRSASAAAHKSTSANEIRTWAQEQGMAVSARGRVSGELRAAFERAHR